MALDDKYLECELAQGWCKTWTLDSELDYGLDYGLDNKYELILELSFGIIYSFTKTENHHLEQQKVCIIVVWTPDLSLFQSAQLKVWGLDYMVCRTRGHISSSQEMNSQTTSQQQYKLTQQQSYNKHAFLLYTHTS